MAAVKHALTELEEHIVRNAHAEAQEGHRHTEALLQIRLDALTGRYSIPEGTSVSFVKEDDGSISLQYENEPPTGTPVLKLYDKNGIAQAGVFDEEDGC